MPSKSKKYDAYRLKVGKPNGPGAKGDKRPKKPGSNPHVPETQRIINAHVCTPSCQVKA